MSRKEKDIYQSLQKQTKRISLRTRLTIAIAIIVLISILGSIGIAWLLYGMFPSLDRVPHLIQINVLILIIAAVLGRLAIRFFTDPIQELRQGFEQVSEGNFDVHLDVKTSFREMQEVIAGFNMMTQELRTIEILQTDFISNVSHEIKTPISAIEGYTTLLQSTDNIDEVENEYIEKILFSTRRLSSLVSNMLLLSKIENQSIPTNRETYRLDEQVREVILALEPMWEPKEIDFDVDLSEVSYYGNENLLYHIWSNLMNNAIKFNPQGGAVKIRLYEKKKSIYFVIEDQGPGLTEEAKKRIFDKFYQEDTSHKEDGNGLGLALVKRILVMLDGEVTVENLPECGCRFTVQLPVSREKVRKK